MIEIPLTNGGAAIVDDEDAPRVLEGVGVEVEPELVDGPPAPIPPVDDRGPQHEPLLG